MNTPIENTVQQEEIWLFWRIMFRVGEHYQNIMDNISERVDRWENASILILNNIRELEDAYRDKFSDAWWLNTIEPRITLANSYTWKRRYNLLTEILHALMKTLNKNS